MKGIILAAGKGTRLYPMTYPVCKPLLPVYDKPMIYYPLDILLKAGIRDILMIVPPDGEINNFKKLLGDGSHIGCKISYVEQSVRRGIADAFILGEEFIGGDNVCLILGDNIFFSFDFEEKYLRPIMKEDEMFSGARIFGYRVTNPSTFGVVEFDEDGKAISLEEKPEVPKSNYAVPGLYFYDNEVCKIAKSIKPSTRGELEITDINLEYLKMDKLNVSIMNWANTFWYDTGTAESLLMASADIYKYQSIYNKYIGCIEETAWCHGYISTDWKNALGDTMGTTEYGQYLLSLK